jgi:hypothetical protein
VLAHERTLGRDIRAPRQLGVDARASRGIEPSVLLRVRMSEAVRSKAVRCTWYNNRSWC